MKKKIIITGGLGYIGTELCKLYSGVSWHHKIIVIDNRFISERVNQIRNWNMEFIQGDILDINLIKKYFNPSIFEFINTKNDIHDFYLFSFCKHFIVSPSSYHWMGAWLNKNENKICLRPNYMTPSNNINFWPEKWIKI